jgi:hypothetical protein
VHSLVLLNHGYYPKVCHFHYAQSTYTHFNFKTNLLAVYTDNVANKTVYKNCLQSLLTCVLQQIKYISHVSLRNFTCPSRYMYPTFNYCSRANKSKPKMPHSNFMPFENLFLVTFTKFTFRFSTILLYRRTVRSIRSDRLCDENTFEFLPTFSHAGTVLLDCWHATVNSSRKHSICQTRVVLVKI